MTATIDSMPNPFNISSAGEVAPKPAGSSDGGVERRHATVVEGVPYSKSQANQLPSTRAYRTKGEEAPSGPSDESRIGTAGVAPGPSEAFLPGLQIGIAGQQLDAVRFMHEIMPPGCENALADDLPVHQPIFLTRWPS